MLLLDNKPGPLYVTAQGGQNTIARALKSIYEQYSKTPQWESVRDKVSAKLVIIPFGDQDGTYAKYIKPNWPEATEWDLNMINYGYGIRGGLAPEKPGAHWPGLESGECSEPAAAGRSLPEFGATARSWIRPTRTVSEIRNRKGRSSAKGIRRRFSTCSIMASEPGRTAALRAAGVESGGRRTQRLAHLPAVEEGNAPIIPVSPDDPGVGPWYRARWKRRQQAAEQRGANLRAFGEEGVAEAGAEGSARSWWPGDSD